MKLINSFIHSLHENEILEIIREDYIQKQKQLGEILSIILENQSTEVLEENLWKLRNLIEVDPDSLEFRIKIINREEISISKIQAEVIKKYRICNKI